jgi:hypothetical protein
MSLAKLKVAELKALCADKGLDDSGVKAVLIERLEAHDAAAEPAAEPAAEHAAAEPKPAAAGAAAAAAAVAPQAAKPADAPVAALAPPTDGVVLDEAAKRAARAARFGTEARAKRIASREFQS